MNETTNSPERVWQGDTGESASSVRSGPATVAYVADFYNRYPSETVTLFARVDVWEPLSDLTLRIVIPPGLVLDDYRAYSRNGSLPYFIGADNAVIWSLEGELQPGMRFEYVVEASIAGLSKEVEMQSEASLRNDAGEIISSETVTISVLVKGKYLKYLPALYEHDELMGRFLMLFESFWAPIETQINSTHYYLDPRITPANFLPWLASWFDLDIDEYLTEAQVRQLIRWAIALHRSRGTKWGLLKYLEIYTGQQAEIIEHRAKNFVWGPETRLGPGIALGRSNMPHTFTITLHLSPIEADSEQESARQERLRRRTIESIIELQKPAHTVYVLNLEMGLPVEMDAQAEAEEPPATGTNTIEDQAKTWFTLDD